jgi:hypothetical protein
VDEDPAPADAPEQHAVGGVVEERGVAQRREVSGARRKGSSSQSPRCGASRSMTTSTTVVVILAEPIQQAQSISKMQMALIQVKI